MTTVLALIALAVLLFAAAGGAWIADHTGQGDTK